MTQEPQGGKVHRRIFAIGFGLSLALALGARSAGAQGPDGQALYKTNCATCHGQAGVPSAGMVKMFKNLKSFADPATFKGLSEDSTVAIIENGIAPGMKGFKGKLTREQAVAVAKYIRGLAKP
jgi:mono/diheme cytochrome c family protein